MSRLQTSLLAALLACFATTEAPAQQTPFALPPLEKRTSSVKSLDGVAISGVQAIPTDVIRRQLANLPEVVEALHPKIDTATFHHRVREAIKRGFLSSGFLDCKLSFQTGSNGVPKITIVEGHRFRRGEIRVTGASEKTNLWLRTRLSELATTGKKPGLVWTVGKPFSGVVVAQAELAEQIRNGLNETGLHGSDADVQFVRDEEKQRVNLVVRVGKQDALWIPPTHDSATHPSKQLLLVAANEKSIERQLERIYQQNFAKPRADCIVVTNDTTTETRIGFGSQQTYAEMFKEIPSPTEKRQQGVCVVFQGNESLITANQIASRDEVPATTWRLPSVRFGFILKQQAVSESKGASALNLTFNWEAHWNKEDDKPMPSGFHFSRLGWQEWFPTESTTIAATNDGKLVRFGNHQLLIDQNGDFVSLSGLSANGSHLEIQAGTDAQIEAARRSPISKPDAKDIFVLDQASGTKMALTEVVRNAFSPINDQHEFYIPPANGQKSVWGVLMLMLVNQERLIEKESLIGKLASLYALQLSGYPRTLPERMDAIQADAMSGPLASFALADIAQRSGQFDRAIELYKNSSFLSQHERAVSRDVNLILDDASLLGQTAQSIDIKSLLQLGLRLTAADANVDLAMMQTLLSMMPDADTEIARRDNCRLVARFVYLAKLHSKIQQTCGARIQQIEVERRKITAKAKKKKDDKAKKAAR